MNTKVGQDKKDDPAMVARTGFDAMMRGEADVASGRKRKLQSTLVCLQNSTRKLAESGSTS